MEKIFSQIFLFRGIGILTSKKTLATESGYDPKSYVKCFNYNKILNNNKSTHSILVTSEAEWKRKSQSIILNFSPFTNAIQ